MKSYAFCKIALLGLFILLGNVASATLLRVNNTLATDNTNHLYASLQEAHDAATNGDTLLVEGTVKEYTQLDCTKKLVIIGTGYFLTQNPGQASTLSSTVEVINFKSGSEGSEIIGLNFSSANSSYSPQIYVNSIAIRRCYLPQGIVINNTIAGLAVLQNYFPSSASAIAVSSSTYSFSMVILKNNIIAGGLSISQPTNVPRVFAVVDHNIFFQNIGIATASFRSNIVDNPGWGLSINSNAIQNNLGFVGTVADALASASSTNQSFSNSSVLFVGTANNSTDGQYHIQSSSPYKTAGYNGEEPGIFGGTEPYVLSGIPPIPSIYELQTDAVANKTDGLNVTIKARANQ